MVLGERRWCRKGGLGRESVVMCRGRGGGRSGREIRGEEYGIIGTLRQGMEETDASGQKQRRERRRRKGVEPEGKEEGANVARGKRD